MPDQEGCDDLSLRQGGSQYTSQKFLDHLKSYGIRPSVGRTGVCWDNAWAESFNATLKNERVYRMVYPTKEKAMNDIASWIELRCESYSPSLSPRVSHSRRGRKRVPGPEEGSLKHKTSTVRKTPSSPDRGSPDRGHSLVGCSPLPPGRHRDQHQTRHPHPQTPPNITIDLNGHEKPPSPKSPQTQPAYSNP